LAGRYKGMTSEELKIFRDAQAVQMEEIQVLSLLLAKNGLRKSRRYFSLSLSIPVSVALSISRELERLAMSANYGLCFESLRAFLLDDFFEGYNFMGFVELSHFVGFDSLGNFRANEPCFITQERPYALYNYCLFTFLGEVLRISRSAAHCIL
jgi:hypothetical protein